MKTYNITQVGSNQSIVVDSYKTASDHFAVNKPDAERMLTEFLQAIQSSNLSERDKTDILEVTTATLQHAQKAGTLTGAAKMAWLGVKEVVATVPGLIAVWRSLTDLFQ